MVLRWACSFQTENQHTCRCHATNAQQLSYSLTTPCSQVHGTATFIAWPSWPYVLLMIHHLLCQDLNYAETLLFAAAEASCLERLEPSSAKAPPGRAAD